eukprot:3756700-Rhodomonas_salina.2
MYKRLGTGKANRKRELGTRIGNREGEYVAANDLSGANRRYKRPARTPASGGNIHGRLVSPEHRVRSRWIFSSAGGMLHSKCVGSCSEGMLVFCSRCVGRSGRAGNF